MTEAPLLEVNQLVKHFPVRSGLFGRHRTHVRAVDGVEFHINTGRTFGLVGESGCGKSTLAMLLVKLLDPTSGGVRFDGKDVLAMRPRER